MFFYFALHKRPLFMEIKLMNIKSPLQRRTILEINKICGIEELALFVTKYKGSINPRDRLLITSQIEYYRSLYNSFVNVEADMLTYLKLAIQTREMLIRCIKKRPSKYLYLLLNLVSYNIDAMAKIKRLA